MTCPKCKAEIPEKFKFCPECGTAVSSASRASGVEADRSLGDLRTRGAASGGADASLGDLKTIQGRGGMGSEYSGNQEPLENRYELQEEIGQGGFARVWKARDKKLGRMVAVKRLLADKLHGASGELALARFRREAQAIAQLNHRNIVAVYDVGRDADGDYLVMELVAGGSLRDLLKQKGKLPETEAVELAKGIGQGLAYAHKKNLVHRDIKPANILLVQEGEGLVPKIVDLGLARAGSESELSATGFGMGTPYYMPPEQRRDAKSVNHTADIYALGKTFYEMLTGEIPDQVDVDKVPPRLAKIILRCVKNNPEERYFSADELIAELEGGKALRPGATGLAGQGEKSNSCVSCGAENPPGAEFCENCGAGLTRNCPECGRKNSLQKRFCGGCGTEMEAFLKWQEALARMEKPREEKRWSRVRKEYGLLPQEVRLPGAKGRQLRERVEALQVEAARAMEQIAGLDRAVEQAMARQDWGAARQALSERSQLDPHDEPAARLLEEASQKLDDQTWQALEQQGTECRQAENWRGALSVYQSYLGSGGAGRHADEARQRLEESKTRLVDQAIREAEGFCGQGRLAEALARIEEALGLVPDAQSLRERRAALKTAIQQEINDSIWLKVRQRAEKSSAAGSWRAAIEDIQAYLAGNFGPSHVEEARQRLQETRAAMAQQIDLETALPMDAGRLPQALGRVEEALELAPDSRILLDKRDVLKAAIKRQAGLLVWEEARQQAEHCRQAGDWAGALKACQSYLGKHAGEGFDDQAQQELARTKRGLVEDAQSQAESLAGQRRYREAFKVLKKASKRVSDDGGLEGFIGELQVRRTEEKQARWKAFMRKVRLVFILGMVVLGIGYWLSVFVKLRLANAAVMRAADRLAMAGDYGAAIAHVDECRNSPLFLARKPPPKAEWRQAYLEQARAAYGRLLDGIDPALLDKLGGENWKVAKMQAAWGENEASGWDQRRLSYENALDSLRKAIEKVQGRQATYEQAKQAYQRLERSSDKKLLDMHGGADWITAKQQAAVGAASESELEKGIQAYGAALEALTLALGHVEKKRATSPAPIPPPAPNPTSARGQDPAATRPPAQAPPVNSAEKAADRPSDVPGELEQALRQLQSSEIDEAALARVFKLRAQAPDDRIKADVLKACGAGARHINRTNIYARIRPLIPDAAEFEQSLFVSCEKCGGSGKVQEECRPCEGRGRCPRCQGRGTVYVDGITRPLKMVCSECKGKGTCSHCGGSGQVARSCPACKGKGGTTRYPEIYQSHVNRALRAFERIRRGETDAGDEWDRMEFGVPGSDPEDPTSAW